MLVANAVFTVFLICWLVAGWRDPDWMWWWDSAPDPHPTPQDWPFEPPDSLLKRGGFALVVGLLIALTWMMPLIDEDDADSSPAPTSEVTPATDPPLR
jgi:hypothetical protein